MDLGYRPCKMLPDKLRKEVILSLAKARKSNPTVINYTICNHVQNGFMLRYASFLETAVYVLPPEWLL